MQRRDLLLALAVGVVISIFLVPTLINTGFWEEIPLSALVSILLVIPVLIIIGVVVANYLNRVIPIMGQFARFVVVGLLNTAIDFGLLNTFVAITGITSGVGIFFMNSISFSTALINSYFWNKLWVFQGNKKGHFLTFVTVTLIGLAINSGIVYTLTTFVPPVFGIRESLWVNVAKVIATGVSLFWNFAGYKMLVFRSSK